MKNGLSVSIVIPVYNEEHHLAACLDSISAQTVVPNEVIVVDNNSTDGTANITQKYPFVRLLREKKQGLIPARNRGFDATKSDILARIDADTLLPAHWVAQVKQDFMHDSGLSGVTGYGENKTRSMYSVPSISRLVSKMYFWFMRGYLGIDVLWGANMAIRANVWRQIKNQVCLDEQIVHEDQDISLLIAGVGGKVGVDPRLTVQFDGATLQDVDTLREYMHRRMTTKKYHIKRGTFDQPGFQCLAWPKLLLYRLATTPLYAFFYFTGIFYTPRAKAHVSTTNRQ